MSTTKPIQTIKFKRKSDRKRLNKRTLEALPLPPEGADGKPGRLWIYDLATPRLAICVWSTGSRTWYWVGRCNGRPLQFKLGEFPEVTPEQARTLAQKVSAQVVGGVDPRDARWEARREMTLGELLEAFIEGHAKPHKRTWTKDGPTFRRYCGSIKGRPLSTIGQADVGALHRKVGRDHGKYAANRLLGLLSKMFSFAGTLGYTVANPCRGVQRFKEEARDRFLTGEELQRFFAALADETELFRDYFTLLLLTGARRGNVEAMRFDELNLDLATWRIPRTKNDQPLTVHLVKEAVEILRRRLADSDGNEWVFEGGKKNPTGHLNSPKGAWKRILERSGLKDLRPHDLRRTLGSWQAATGASLPVIGKSLGHRNQSTTQIYARLNLDPVRTAVDTAVAAMLKAGGA
jgi:integrase